MTAKPKVFAIGFNKTATTTIHKFFRDNGHDSIHYRLPDGRFLAGVVSTNVMSRRPILASIDQHEVFSEFSYTEGTHFLEANYFYQDLYEQYPDAYFLLNTRDTEGWVKSRSNHFGRKKSRGLLGDRIAASYGTSTEEASDIWRALHQPFHDEVIAFFAARPEARFLHFEIETGTPEMLTEWVSEHYDLDPSIWAAANTTQERQQKEKVQRNPARRLLKKIVRRVKKTQL